MARHLCFFSLADWKLRQGQLDFRCRKWRWDLVQQNEVLLVIKINSPCGSPPSEARPLLPQIAYYDAYICYAICQLVLDGGLSKLSLRRIRFLKSYEVEQFDLLIASVASNNGRQENGGRSRRLRCCIWSPYNSFLSHIYVIAADPNPSSHRNPDVTNARSITAA